MLAGGSPSQSQVWEMRVVSFCLRGTQETVPAWRASLPLIPSHLSPGSQCALWAFWGLFPLQDCTYGTDILGQWKGLLENDQLLSHGGQDLSSDAFHR